MTTRARAVLLLAILALVVTTSAPARAQVTTGTPPFGSFAAGPDIINLANLNAHLDIPVLAKSGRGGFNFTYDLSYDTSTWYPVGAIGYQSWQPVYNWGWRAITEAGTGYISFTETVSTGCHAGTNYGQTTTFSDWTYHDPWGVPHWFAITTYYYQGPAAYCPNSGTSTSGTATSDGGYTLSVTGQGVNSLLASDGRKIQAPVNVGTGVAGLTDRNGNEITVNGSGQFFDTLSSTTPVLTVANSGSPPTQTTFTYTAPSGASPYYKMVYTAYTVQTHFACSVTDYGPISQNLVSEIDLPDNSKYTFVYESTLGGTSGAVTGRIASVTLPTGGEIKYTYLGGDSSHNGIECSDGSAIGLQRSTPDTGSNYWTYAQVKGSGAASTTTVTDPQSNQTTIQFQGIYETRRVSSLLTTNTCYNGATSPCTGIAITPPISQRTALTQLPNGLQSEHAETYSAYGVPTEIDDYDYGASTPFRKVSITYASLNTINSFKQIVNVQDGSGHTAAQTTYNYDEGTVQPSSGTPQHVGITGSRGNLTSIDYPVSGLVAHFTYYDTGTIYNATDGNGAVTTYSYSACGNAFPTSVTEPLGLLRYMTWNCTGGVQLTAKDENGQTTTTAYTDAYFWRPHAVTDPLNNQTTLGYDGYGYFSDLVFNGNASDSESATGIDGLGRPIEFAHLESLAGPPYLFDQVVQSYDPLGRVGRVYMPCVDSTTDWAPSNWTCSTPYTSYSYDALNRPTSVTDGGGGTIAYSYTGNDVLITIGPAPSGENTKRRQLEYDALGRLTSVCEITNAPGSGTCGQNVQQTGFWTKYNYDALGNLTAVTQSGQVNPNCSQQQSRCFSYDAMSRLTSESNPESGTTTYTYDSANVGACNLTSKGDLIMRTNAAGVSTCNGYDALHRLLSVGHNPAQANNTPDKFFVYDAATVNGTQMVNVKGRLAEAYTCMSPCTKVTDEGFSYTARGEVSDLYQSMPNSGGYYHANASYWANGALNTLSGPVGYYMSWNVDGEGRAYATSNTAALTSTSYNSASQPTQIKLGSGDSDAFAYDSNTGRMTQYSSNVNGQSVVGNLTWNANGTLATLGINDPFNSADTQTCNYSHDDLVRLASVNCGAATWQQNFSYDAFGNIVKSVPQGGTADSFAAMYSTTTNQMTSIGGQTPRYDASGNVTNDFLHTYSWDADGHALTIDGVGITYDALGRMVEQNRSGAYTEIGYSPTGFEEVLANGQSYTKAFVPLPAGAMAVWTASGLTYYRHPDWLGSSRFASTPSRTTYYDGAYAPFGETYAQTGATDVNFTGMNSDVTPKLYDFPAREYGIQGRWPSPDPAGLAAADPSNPQSWNRYGYVLDDPLDLIDPLGLDGTPCTVNGQFGFCDTSTLSVDAGIGGFAGAGAGAEGMEDPGSLIWCMRAAHSMGIKGDLIAYCTLGGNSSGSNRNPVKVCIDPKSLNFLQRAQLFAAQTYANLTGWTFGFGAGLDAGAGVGPKGTSLNFGVGGSASTLIVADASGNSGILNSASGGVSVVKTSSPGSWWGAGAAAGPSVLVSPFSINTIAGPSFSVSGGGGAVLGAGANVTTSGAATFTFGVGAGAEGGGSGQFGPSQFVPFCHK